MAGRSDYVRQRQGKDCVVASLATVTGRSYEEIFDILGCQPDLDGFTAFGLPLPLLKVGYSATILFPREVGERFGPSDHLAPRADIAAAIADKPALLLVSVEAVGMPDHVLAWHEGQAICGSRGVISDTLDDVAFEAAIVVSRLSSIHTDAVLSPGLASERAA